MFKSNQLFTMSSQEYVQKSWMHHHQFENDWFLWNNLQMIK